MAEFCCHCIGPSLIPRTNPRCICCDNANFLSSLILLSLGKDNRTNTVKMYINNKTKIRHRNFFLHSNTTRNLQVIDIKTRNIPSASFHRQSQRAQTIAGRYCMFVRDVNIYRRFAVGIEPCHKDGQVLLLVIGFTFKFGFFPHSYPV